MNTITKRNLWDDLLGTLVATRNKPSNRNGVMTEL
jgi:hypothetical protein